MPIVRQKQAPDFVIKSGAVASVVFIFYFFFFTKITAAPKPTPAAIIATIRNFHQGSSSFCGLSGVLVVVGACVSEVLPSVLTVGCSEGTVGVVGFVGVIVGSVDSCG